VNKQIRTPSLRGTKQSMNKLTIDNTLTDEAEKSPLGDLGANKTQNH